MAGKFTDAFYQLSTYDTLVCNIRVQPETIAAAAGSDTNGSAVGPANYNVTATVGGSVRRRGLHARLLYLRLASGATPPTGYSATTKTAIPALTRAFYSAAINAKTVTYLGTTWVVTSRPEYYRL